MAKQNFGIQLAKGFIRSAINQVGRDGGRVVSNQIYNGQNYVPVAPVSPNASFQSANLPLEAEATTKNFSGGKIAMLALASFMFSIIGSVSVFFYGLSTYLKKTEKIKWYEDVPQYAPDNRCKTGERFLGYITVKREKSIPASPESIQINKKNGKIAMIIGGMGLVLFAIFMISASLSK